MSAVIEKYSTLLPRNGQGKRIIKAKLLTALGATGVLLPFPQNPEHIIERKILLQTPFTAPGQGGGPPPPVGNGLLKGLISYWIMNEATNATRVDKIGTSNLANAGSIPQVGGTPMANLGGIGAGMPLQAGGNALVTGLSTPYNPQTYASGSFTIGGWVEYGSQQFATILTKDDGVGGSGTNNYSYGIIQTAAAGTTCVPYANDNGVLLLSGSIPFTGQPNFDYLIFGYNGPLKQLFWSLNAGAISTLQLTTGIKASTASFSFFNTSTGTQSASQSVCQDFGWWDRVLSQTDINNLYNGHAGLPFSSFQNF